WSVVVKNSSSFLRPGLGVNGILCIFIWGCLRKFDKNFFTYTSSKLIIQFLKHPYYSKQNSGFAPECTRSSWFVIDRVPFIKTIIIFNPFHHGYRLVIGLPNKSVFN